jgi:NAD(P)-dependent dehydrogenase (short-subunit alcohol dehydrogenase family)
VNAKGVFLGTRAAIPAMKDAGGGSIINISSIAGLVGLYPATGASSAYASSKGAVRLLTKSTAIQYAADGIRCNSVHPGYIDTAMTERMLSQPDIREQRIAATPLGRIGNVDDIAYGVLFLASEEASFMTGSELVIDGGWTAQ